MKQKLFLASLFLLPALFGENGSPYYQRVGEQALAQIHWDWKSLLGSWRIHFLPGRVGYLGMAYLNECRIDIWVRPDQKASAVAGIIVHELAHRVDYLYITEEQRDEWRRIRGIPQKTPWLLMVPVSMASSDSPPTDDDIGAGDFAKCVAWTLQGAYAKFSKPLGPPTQKQQQVIRQWLAQLNTAGN
jgi:hypothetical protein